MEYIKIKINQSLKNRLDSNNKKVFAKAQEELIAKVLCQIYDDDNGNEPIKIIYLTEKYMNIYLGDLQVIYLNHDDETFTIEVKSSNFHDDKCKQILELEHYNDEDLKNPYIQKSTNSAEGWFYVNKASCLISYNRRYKRLYIVYDWLDVKKRIEDMITIDKSRKYKRINDYLEQVIMKDSYKDKDFGYEIIQKYDLCVSLDLEQLDKVSNYFEVFELEFDIIDEDSDNR